MTSASRYLLVFADSTAFHGPGQVEPPTEPKLHPNVCARHLGPGVAVDLVARPGMTARDAWWALTKDPVVWGVELPRATGILLSVGHMDQLPAALPTWLREGIAYVRPGWLRRRVRRTYLGTAPAIIRASGGRLAQLPTAATQHYLSRMVDAIRVFRPDVPIVRHLPGPYDSDRYPSQRHHADAVQAADAWCLRQGVGPVPMDDLVGVDLAAGLNNVDGMHWGWNTHDRIGRATADAFVRAGWPAVTTVGESEAVPQAQ
ncbi:MAG: SGNH/GDSL hydrolase family protein [Candidatus Nanopelagicales bacterium]|nr:SGNH/GDSL hydrolase family protein [Candidatus Nanopelagicales bacterium]MDZ4250482.1 SGNH/GDSL hydrolase family protein [Candidatus Nanopelagicales bacterium]